VGALRITQNARKSKAEGNRALTCYRKPLDVAHLTMHRRFRKPTLTLSFGAYGGNPRIEKAQAARPEHRSEPALRPSGRASRYPRLRVGRSKDRSGNAVKPSSCAVGFVVASDDSSVRRFPTTTTRLLSASFFSLRGLGSRFSDRLQARSLLMVIVPSGEVAERLPLKDEIP